MLLPPRGEDNGFGDIEAALMVTDAGALEDGKEVVTLGGTYNGLDTALVVKTCWSGDFLYKIRGAGAHRQAPPDLDQAPRIRAGRLEG